MPGVFEPCTRLDHLGWLRYLASQTPLSRSIGSLASCSATGPFGSGDLGIIEQQLNQCSNQLVPALPSCDAFASDWSIPRTPGSVSSSHHPSPLPRATYDWAYPIGSPFSIAMYGVTDSCAKTLGKYCSCTSASVGRASSPPHHRRYEIDLATIEHRKVMPVMRRSVTESLLLVTDAVLCDA